MNFDGVPTLDVVTAKVPPRWFVRLAWKIHRGLYRVLGRRAGIRRPRPGKWGMLRLTTIGRRSGTERAVILAYMEDGPRFATLAMNGWGAGEPAWWLNLRAHPEATVEVRDGFRTVHAREATGAARERLWALFRSTDTKLDEYAALRPSETAVVVLSPSGFIPSGEAPPGT